MAQASESRVGLGSGRPSRRGSGNGRASGSQEHCVRWRPWSVLSRGEGVSVHFRRTQHGSWESS